MNNTKLFDFSLKLLVLLLTPFQKSDMLCEIENSSTVQLMKESTSFSLLFSCFFIKIFFFDDVLSLLHTLTAVLVHSRQDFVAEYLLRKIIKEARIWKFGVKDFDRFVCYCKSEEGSQLFCV